MSLPITDRYSARMALRHGGFGRFHAPKKENSLIKVPGCCAETGRGWKRGPRDGRFSSSAPTNSIVASCTVTPIAKRPNSTGFPSSPFTNS